MAAGLGWNGSTFTWVPALGGGGSQTPLRSIQFTDSPAIVDVGGSTSTTHSSAVGRKRQTLAVEIEGANKTALTLGGKGASTILLNDTGANGSFANGVIVSKTVAGRLDGDVTTSISIRPCNA